MAPKEIIKIEASLRAEKAKNKELKDRLQKIRALVMPLKNCKKNISTLVKPLKLE